MRMDLLIGETVLDTRDRHRNDRHRSQHGCDHRDCKRRHAAGRRDHECHGHARATEQADPARRLGRHHIVDQDVANAPAFGEVIDRFQGAHFYVAHNCEFERSFFAAQGIELGPWVCTYKC
jgi:hypothetical protein